MASHIKDINIHLAWHQSIHHIPNLNHTSKHASHIISYKATTYESSNHSKDIGNKHIILSLKTLHVHFENTQPNKHVHLYHQSKITPQMHEHYKCMNYLLLTLQQLITYDIMHEHMNAWSWHWNNKTLILACETNQAIKHVKHRHWKHKSMGKEGKQTNMWKQKWNKQNKN